MAASKSKIEVQLSAKDLNLLSTIDRSVAGIKRIGSTATQEAAKAKGAFSRLSEIKFPIVVSAGVAAAAYYANEVRKIADEYTNLNSRIKLVTDSEEETVAVRERLYKISQETGSAYASNADAFAKLARNMRDLGKGSGETLDAVDLVNKSLTINGSTTEMASSFMLQFSQAMGSGVLQGDEFRSMMENNGYFASELAKALNVDIAGLRAMSKAGELTTSVLTKAFPKMAEAVNSEFSKIAPTTQRALMTLENAYKRIIDESNQASGGTGKIAKSITDLAETMDQNREGISSFFSFIIDMAAGATDKLAKLSQIIINIGQSSAGWSAVFDGKMSFFEFATMDAKELNSWIKENAKSLNATAAAAKKTGSEIAAAAKTSGGEQLKVSKETLKEMERQYKDYAAEVKKIQADIAGSQRDFVSEIRDMQQGGMSGIDAWRANKKEAQEYTVKAKEAAAASQAAFSAGDAEGGKSLYSAALDYANKAASAARELNKEVMGNDKALDDAAKRAKSYYDQLDSEMKEMRANLENRGYSTSTIDASLVHTKARVDQARTAYEALEAKAKGAESVIAVSDKQGLAESVRMLTEVQAVKEQIQQQVQAAMKQAGEALNKESGGVLDESIVKTKSQLDDLAKAAEEVKGKMQQALGVAFTPPEDGDWGKVWNAMESGSTKASDAVSGQWDKTWDDFLSSGVEDIATIESHLQKLSKDRHVKIYVTEVQAKATGGLIQRFARGGRLPGYGGGDRISALLEAGEFVIRKEAVSKFGAGLFHALNALQLPEIPRFALGGPVGFANGGAVGGSDTMTINLNFGGGASIPVTSTRENARALEREFKRMAWRSSK
jgi:tape measure domain-containing protein